MGTDRPFHALGVGLDASGDEIRAAYRARLKASHPDHGGSRAALDEVLAAYQELRQLGVLERRRRRDDPYARSLRDLARVANPGPRQWVDVESRSRPLGGTGPGRRPSDRFGELLRMELRRQAPPAPAQTGGHRLAE